MREIFNESMTREAAEVHEKIVKILEEQGYTYFAKLFKLMHLNLTKPNSVETLGGKGKSPTVAYINVNDASITINRNLDEKYYSLIIRHEIMHHVLKHEERALRKLAQMLHLDYSKLSSSTINELSQILHSDDIANIWMDAEDSNRGYTEADEQLALGLTLNNKLLGGIVTQYFGKSDKEQFGPYKDWQNMSFEEMYEAFLKLPVGQEALLVKGQLIDENTFIDTEGNIYED